MKKKLAIVSLIVLSVFSLFIAGCSKKTEKYTVTFDSDGGTEIASVQVEKGKKITKPEDPSKEHYVFGGWYLEDTEWVFESDTVTKNTALTAKWTPEVYSVTLKNYDGTVLATENVSYGSLPQYSATPEKPSDAQYTYAFSKWVDEAGNDASLSNIDKNVTLTATFTSTLRSYKIIFKNGEQVLKEETVNYGTMPAAPETNPTKGYDSENHYSFKGWDKEIAEVTGEAVYNAQFNAEKHVYTVDDSDETTDYIVCSCGYKDETYAYDKRVTSNRKELPVDGTGLSLTVDGATFASVEKMTINGVDVSGEITSFVIPDAVKIDKERHGLQDVILTVKDQLGYSHTLKVPVTLITKEIATLGDLNAALKGEGDEYTIFGYYKLTENIGSENYDGIQNGNSPVKWQNAGGLYGFRGTFDGNNHSISAIIYSNGIFGIIGKGACIKDLTVNAYQYVNGRTTLARSITEATLENVEINVKSGSSNSYYAEGGVITALLSHSSKYIGVKVNATTDLDTLFGFSYWSYDPKKANTFENCEVNAKSIGGIICITAADKIPNPIVSVAGVEGLSVTFLKDAVTADDMTIGQAAEIDTGLSEITSITLNGEEFTSYAFANGTLTINADAFNAFEAGKKTFKIVGKNADGITIKFDLVITVKLVTTAVTAGNGEIVLSDAAEYAVSLGDYADGAVINAIFADENVTYANGKLTLTDAFKNNAQKHGNQTLVVTVEKGGTYYAVSVNVLVVTKEISTIDELNAVLTPDSSNVIYGYYRLTQNVGSSGAWINNANSGSWQNVNGEVGFRGVFEGNGFSIDGAFAANGLFGIIGKGAVVKNIICNVYYYTNTRANLARSITEATIDSVTINIKSVSGTLNVASEGGVIAGLLSHSSVYKKVVVNAKGFDLDTLFGYGYGNYNANKPNTFEKCEVNAKSLGGLLYHSGSAVPATGIDGLAVNLSA